MKNRQTMSIFNKVKQAFGFGVPELEDDDTGYGIDATVTPLRRSRPEPEKSDSIQSIENTVVTETKAVENVPVEAIFQTVITVFNDSLPAFVKESVDLDSQKKYLYEALENDVKEYLERVNEAARATCSTQWEAERLKLNKELSVLRDKVRNTEDGAAEKGRQLLSAERQKRAINERVHDLENQVAKLEAEKEQYILENRSLVNKLRVMNVMGDSADGVGMDDIAGRLEQFEAEKSELASKVEELTSERDSIAATLAAAVEETDALKLKAAMNDTMFKDLNDRASEATKTVAQKDEQINSLKEELASARDHEADLTKTMKDAIAEADILRNDLEEARANLEIAAQIQLEVEKVKSILDKKTTQINDLNLELRRRDDRINALEIEEKSLRRTIDNNIRAQAESEAALHEKIDELEKQAAAARDKSRQRRKTSTTPKISAIDEDLDNTDWLVATPPEGTSVKTSGVSDAEFGYQEPARKTPPENSAQMSLW